MIDPRPIIRLIQQRGDKVVLVSQTTQSQRDIRYGAPVINKVKQEQQLLAYVVPDSAVAAAAIASGQLKGGTHLCYVMGASLDVGKLTPEHRIVYRGVSYQIIVLEPITWRGRTLLVQLRLSLTQDSKQVSTTTGIQSNPNALPS